MADTDLNIIVEDKIPFVRGVLEKAGLRVSYLPAAAIDADAVAGADALMTRTRTRCDSRLLSGSRVRAIATATIGTDHIDLDYCRDHGIAVRNAPGCNAPGVAQYVMAAILAHADALGLDLSGLTLGVVGAGNVGGLVARWAESMGMTVLLCDPPLSRTDTSRSYVGMDRIARDADVITFHTPLTKAPDPDATYHLCDAAFLGSLRKRPLIINSARGGVVDEQALLDALDRGIVAPPVIDCWEGEPAIDRRLLEAARIATPHIAGYSRQGKIRATQMALDALTSILGLQPLSADCPPAPAPPQAVTAAMIRASYDPAGDTSRLKSHPETFEQQRDNYALRDEPHCI